MNFPLATVQPTTGKRVIRLADAAYGRIESVTRTTVVVDLGALGSKVCSRREFAAEFRLAVKGATRYNS